MPRRSNVRLIDRFEIFARPVRGKRFFQKSLEASEAKLANPIRVLFHIRDIMDRFLAESGARIAHVHLRVSEVPDAPINVDC